MTPIPGPGEPLEPDELQQIESGEAITAEAAPPNPLNIATSCGIDVISTLRAENAPIADPTSAPPRIHSHEAMSLPTTVATMAINIANADMRLPFRAVAGEPSCFSPTMKRIAAMTYAAFVTVTPLSPNR